MKLRNVEERDLMNCTKIFMEVFNAEPWNDEWTDGIALQYLTDFYGTPNFLGIAAVENEEVLGFIFGVQRKWYSGDEYFIHEMCVDSKRQSEGIGKMMLQELEKHLQAKSIDNIALLTNRNIPAEQFYKNNGFEEIERLVFLHKEIE
ncbi:GNAT family N-acetyltransferase [Solibacillus silvestris]|uniref:GNAT family N-acetyltransferase n=1 Tax=Solibacillus silvestris TaxID=76853 RepID=UPI003F7E04A5